MRYLTIILLVICALANAGAQDLPRATAASQGIDERGLMNFIDTLASLPNTSVHHLMVVRHGKVVAEAHPSPYTQADVHAMYSVSKTVTALAVGIAADRGLLNVDDKVVSFFPDKVPANTDPRLREVTVWNLLTMTSGIRNNPLTREKYNDWVLGWLERGMVASPGSKWEYDTMSTLMLSAIVQKVTGKKMLDYLNENLLTPMGITEADWEESPTGINAGGWGLRLNTESQAKLGVLMLNYGKWDGRQLVSRRWIEQMTSEQYRIYVPKPDIPKTMVGKIKYYLKLAWAHVKSWFTGRPAEIVKFWESYGYQTKILHHPTFEAFFAVGLYGQTIYMNRERDLVVVINSSAPGYGTAFKAIWSVLFPACLSEPRGDSGLDSDIQAKLASLDHKPVSGEVFNTNEAKYTRPKKHLLAGNHMNVRSFTVGIADSVCTMGIADEQGNLSMIRCGYGKWLTNALTTPPPNDFHALGALSGLHGEWRVAGSYAWTGPHRLRIDLYYTNWVTYRQIIIDFWNDEISINDNFNPETSQTVMFNN